MANAAAPSQTRSRNHDPTHEPSEIWGDETYAPDLPHGILPPSLEALAFAKRSLYPPAALGMAAMAACSMAASDNWRVAINETYRERFCIWVGLVGSSATGKSPTINLAMRPLNKLQSAMVDAWKKATEERSVRAAAAKMEKQFFDEPLPKITRLTTQNATIEAITELERDNPHGMGLVHDELSTVFAAMDGGYKEKSASDRGHWLALYDGGPHVTDRIGRGTVFVENHSAAILGGITTDKLRGMVSSMSADGLMARMSLVLMPATTPSEDLTSVDLRTFNTYSDVVQCIVAHRPDCEREIPMTDAARCTLGKAKKSWQDFSIRQTDHLPRFSERLNKLLGLTSRFALGFAIIEAAENLVGGKTPYFNVQVVSDEHMRRAVALAEYLSLHDLAFYAGLARRCVSPSLTLARHIGAWLLRSDVENFILGNVSQQVVQWRDACTLDQFGALSFLEECSWIHPNVAEGQDFFRGRSFIRGIVWHVNPLLHGRFKDQRERERLRAADMKRKLERAVAERRAEIESELVCP
jgi:hypothetical protein